ncbi:unnamed protein product [Nyctereutes procyonoides]|uniref:Ribosome production factor 2 homolog n=1 Tax=Nyctereutes procyonoides TaxID=34880 RepID=A0A811ZBL0_NYCPR|nr:unnamed protein product [Nyctereutes procyonoides]
MKCSKIRKSERELLHTHACTYKIPIPGIPGWCSGLAPAFGSGRDPGDPGSYPTLGSQCMEPASPSAFVKPKTKRAKRFLEKKEPKLSENIKNAIDVYALKKLYGVLYKKKNMGRLGGSAKRKTNITRPFEDQTSLEFFSKKSDCSLFMFGSHSRIYDYHVLDMIELGIGKFRRLKILPIDFFRSPTVTNIHLAGLEYVLHFSLVLKESGCRTPRIKLDEMGPSWIWKTVSHDTFSTTYRRIHMQKEELRKLQTRNMEGLKKQPVQRITEDQEKKMKENFLKNDRKNK